MVRWLIGAYIVIVLIISVKAAARTSLESNPTVQKFNGQTESSKVLNVQDPLPGMKNEDLRPIDFSLLLENSVG